jgi:hypothetical protein
VPKEEKNSEKENTKRDREKDKKKRTRKKEKETNTVLCQLSTKVKQVKHRIKPK